MLDFYTADLHSRIKGAVTQHSFLNPPDVGETASTYGAMGMDSAVPVTSAANFVSAMATNVPIVKMAHSCTIMPVPPYAPAGFMPTAAIFMSDTGWTFTQ